MLKLLLDNFKLLRVCKGVLRFDNLLELVTKAGTLFCVKFNLDFTLAQARRPNISLQSFDLVPNHRLFMLQIFDLTLEIDYEMCLGVET